jgi:hypothetical protein
MGRCLHSNRTPKGGSGGHARRWRWLTTLVLKTPHSPPCAAVCTRCRHDSLRSGALSSMIPCFRLEPSQRAAERVRAARGSGGRGRAWVWGRQARDTRGAGGRRLRNGGMRAERRKDPLLDRAPRNQLPCTRGRLRQKLGEQLPAGPSIPSTSEGLSRGLPVRSSF